MSFGAGSYSTHAAVELKRLEIPGYPDAPLPSPGILKLKLVEPISSDPYMQKERERGIHRAVLVGPTAITQAGLARVVTRHQVKVVVCVAVTNNGRTEEGEITYLLTGGSFGHLQSID